jgi:ribosomal protein S18 acetylase RimI-like enzyme
MVGHLEGGRSHAAMSVLKRPVRALGAGARAPGPGAQSMCSALVSMRLVKNIRFRSATPSDMAEVSALRVTAYRAGGFLSAESGYEPTLRDLGADGNGHVLIASAPAGPDDAEAPELASSAAPTERLVGTIMLQSWPHTGPVVTGPDEAEIRALAVRPDSQGQGIGRELLRRTLDRASGLGVRRLVLCTGPEMRAAHRLYEQAGFIRLPERDWSPAPGVSLLVYGLNIAKS